MTNRWFCGKYFTFFEIPIFFWKRFHYLNIFLVEICFQLQIFFVRQNFFLFEIFLRCGNCNIFIRGANFTIFVRGGNLVIDQPYQLSINQLQADKMR